MVTTNKKTVTLLTSDASYGGAFQLDKHGNTGAPLGVVTYIKTKLGVTRDYNSMLELKRFCDIKQVNALGKAYNRAIIKRRFEIKKAVALAVAHPTFLHHARVTVAKNGVIEFNFSIRPDGTLVAERDGVKAGHRKAENRFLQESGPKAKRSKRAGDFYKCGRRLPGSYGKSQ